MPRSETYRLHVITMSPKEKRAQRPDKEMDFGSKRVPLFLFRYPFQSPSWLPSIPQGSREPVPLV